MCIRQGNLSGKYKINCIEYKIKQLRTPNLGMYMGRPTSRRDRDDRRSPSYGRRRYDYTNIYARFAHTHSTEGGRGGVKKVRIPVREVKHRA